MLPDGPDRSGGDHPVATADRQGGVLCHSGVMEARDPLMSSALDEKLGLEITSATAERVTGRAPVTGNTQPMGLWHGGASAVMVETLGSVAANLHAGDGAAVGTEINVSHLRPATSGWVHGTAQAIHLGRTSAVYQVDLTDDQGRLIATGRLSCRILADE